MHGDLFDGVIQCAKWLAHVGDSLYEFTLKLNRHLNSLRARMGLPYWSLSKYLKQKVKRAVSYVGDFESAVAREARKRGVQGVVCGHIHHAEMRDIDGILYCNDGDWVESLTALAEHADGSLEILHWAEHCRRSPALGACGSAARAGARMSAMRRADRRPRLLQRRRRPSRFGAGAGSRDRARGPAVDRAAGQPARGARPEGQLPQADRHGPRGRLQQAARARLDAGPGAGTQAAAGHDPLGPRAAACGSCSSTGWRPSPTWSCR